MSLIKITTPNPFQIFSLSESFDIDKNNLKYSYYNLMNQSKDEEQMKKINWAYSLLKNDLDRAKWLNNVYQNEETTTSLLKESDLSEILSLSELSDQNKRKLKKLINECKTNWNKPYYLERWRFLDAIDQRMGLLS
ncbi:HSB-like chaperone-like protein [Pseudoloma neurophilia]|uniref:HSB-like chaperone-like protein n=1 Tax=Pseudoloma neurophilia TaxID=146866 RepID=A0A0R0M126_9MICR|nr:HSB-like chaperone-like protein [Pseudoloma neurophilia]